MTGTHGFTSKSLVCEMRFVFEKETQDEYNHHFIRFEAYLIYHALIICLKSFRLRFY